jgi:hypothetical protein
MIKLVLRKSHNWNLVLLKGSFLMEHKYHPFPPYCQKSILLDNSVLFFLLFLYFIMTFLFFKHNASFYFLFHFPFFHLFWLVRLRSAFLGCDFSSLTELWAQLDSAIHLKKKTHNRRLRLCWFTHPNAVITYAYI